jgi:hypothetical protein
MMRLSCMLVALLASERVQAGSVEIVLAHFNEDLKWLSTLMQNEAKDAKVTLYTKGPETSTLKLVPDAIVRQLPNVGRESHTFLHHIVHNFDKLADWTVFSQAGEPSFGYKGHRAGGGHLLAGDSFANYLIPRPSGFRFIHTSAIHLPSMNHVLREAYCIDDKTVEDQQGVTECPQQHKFWTPWWDIDMFKEYIMSKVAHQHGEQPLDFYRKYINPFFTGSEIVVPFAQGARFAVSKETILSHPKEQYERLLAALSNDQDPYSGYFMEWLWSELLIGQNHHCKIPERSIVLRHEDAMSTLLKTFESRRSGSSQVRQLGMFTEGLGMSGGIVGISGISGKEPGNSSTSQPADVTTTLSTSKQSGSSSTTPLAHQDQQDDQANSSSNEEVGQDTTTIPISTGNKQVIVKVTGSVTITVSNCSAFVAEPNSVKAVQDGLRKAFLGSKTDSRVQLAVLLTCATSRRLSMRRLSESVDGQYTITIPPTVTGIDVNVVKNSIVASSPASLTDSISGAMAQYSFSGNFTVAVTSVSTPSVATTVASDGKIGESSANKAMATLLAAFMTVSCWIL